MCALEKLQKQITAQDEAHKAELVRLNWQLYREQQRFKQLYSDLDMAASAPKAAHAELEVERSMR